MREALEALVNEVVDDLLEGSRLEEEVVLETARARLLERIRGDELALEGGAALELLVRFVRMNPSVAADSPIVERVARAYRADLVGAAVPSPGSLGGRFRAAGVDPSEVSKVPAVDPLPEWTDDDLDRFERAFGRGAPDAG